MNIQLLKGIFFFAILLLIQLMVLNHIHFFNCATPLTLCIYGIAISTQLSAGLDYCYAL